MDLTRPDFKVLFILIFYRWEKKKEKNKINKGEKGKNGVLVTRGMEVRLRVGVEEEGRNGAG